MQQIGANKLMVRRIISSVVLSTFLLTSGIAPYVHAQEASQLPQPGSRVGLSPAFMPPLLQGVKVYPDNPFKLDFVLDKGDSAASTEDLKAESARLIKYFLASITVPENDLWVNLSPYEKDRIIPDGFGVTEMGRDLLAQDYMLKQITASVIYPEEKIGKEFWDKVYTEAQRRFGSTEVPVDTFNKVWIVPEKAVVYENKDSAYIVESHLKVLLEEDYLALAKGAVDKGVSGESKETNKLGTEIIREVVIPILEKEVNEGKNFVQLRQVYHSLILAIWLKNKIKKSIFGQTYVDQGKVAGVDIEDKDAKEKIWAQYIEAFKKGAYNYVKEDFDPATQQVVPRKYFSGGASLYQVRSVLRVTNDRAMLGGSIKKGLMILGVSLVLAVSGVALYYSLSQKKVEHYVPPGNQILLIVGQQKESIEQYVQKVKVPAGFMTYTSLKDLEGLMGPADRGAGTQYAQDLVDRYPNTVLQIGLSLVGELDNINNGKYGENIKRLGDWIKQSRVPVFLRIGYEFDNPENNYYPNKYKTAFRRIVDQLREVEHVENAVFVWHSNSYGQGVSFKEYYPGDKYVDWVGMSYFEKGNETVGEEISKFADEKGKPKMICEASPWHTTSSESKAAWFKGFFEFVRQHNIKAIGYINSNWDELPLFQEHKYGDSRVDSDPTVLNLWNGETRDGYLNSSDKLYKEINYDPNKKNADQAMSASRKSVSEGSEQRDNSQKTNAIQNAVKSPIFFPLFSAGLAAVAGYFYGPVAAVMFFTPFVLTAFLSILQDITHVVPGDVESKYYVDRLEELPVGQAYPSASVVVPVYREPFEVLQKTIVQANKAVHFYNLRARGNEANLIVLDDGLQTLDQPDRDIRVKFYQQMGVSVLARPPNNVGGFKRTGFFKKASNLNYAFELDSRIRKLLRDNPRATQTQILQQLKSRVSAETRYDLLFSQGNNILLGDFILLIDNDSYTPEKSLVYSVHSLLRRPQAGYIQHVSQASNKDDNLLTKVYALSTSVFWRIVLKARSLYAPTAILGHNLVLRKTALEDVVKNSSEPGPFHEGRGADDLVPGINMRTGEHGYYGMLGNMPFQKGFEEGIPNVYSDLAGQMRRYGATGTGSIINPLSLWFKEGIFRPEFSALLKDKKISFGEKFDTFFYAQHGLQNLFMMSMVGVAIAMVYLGIENALAIGFIRGIIFATTGQLAAVIYFQLKSLKDPSWKGVARTILFSPPLYFCLGFQNAIGVIYDLLLSGAKSYGSTAIRKPSERSGSRFMEIFRNNKLQIITGFTVLGIMTSLLFVTISQYSILNVLALILYLFYFGTSLVTTPFIFSREPKSLSDSAMIAQEKGETFVDTQRSLVSEPHDQAQKAGVRVISEEYSRFLNSNGGGVLRQAFEKSGLLGQDGAQNVENAGGVDLSAANAHLETRNNGEGMTFRIDPAMLQQLKESRGFTPIINTIDPVSDLNGFLDVPQEVGAIN